MAPATTPRSSYSFSPRRRPLLRNWAFHGGKALRVRHTVRVFIMMVRSGCCLSGCSSSGREPRRGGRKQCTQAGSAQALRSVSQRDSELGWSESHRGHSGNLRRSSWCLLAHSHSWWRRAKQPPPATVLLQRRAGAVATRSGQQALRVWRAGAACQSKGAAVVLLRARTKLMRLLRTRTLRVSQSHLPVACMASR